MTSKLGKIAEVRFGRGGYDNAMFGISFVLENEIGTVQDFWGTWSDDTGKPEAWKKGQLEFFGSTMKRINNLLTEARKQNVADLAGTPVEIIFNGDALSSWRVLKEVL